MATFSSLVAFLVVSGPPHSLWHPGDSLDWPAFAEFPEGIYRGRGSVGHSLLGLQKPGICPDLIRALLHRGCAKNSQLEIGGYLPGARSGLSYPAGDHGARSIPYTRAKVYAALFLGYLAPVRADRPGNRI